MGSESSLEMDDERHFNELAAYGSSGFRDRAISSPIPYPSPNASNITTTPHPRPKSPANIHTGMTHPTPPGGFSAFTPPSPLGSGRVSSSSSAAGTSPPFITKCPRSFTQSPKLARKGGSAKDRPLSGGMSERQRSGHIRTNSSNTSERPVSGN